MPVFNVADNLDSVGDSLVNEIPEPQQHAIDQAAKDAEEATGEAAASVDLDVLGVPWNPEIHATGADGKGIPTAKGAWRKRRGLKGSASHLNTGAAAAPKDPKEDPTLTEQRTREHQNRMAGAMAGTMLVRISAAFGGPEFLPRTINIPGGLTYNEEEFLQSAFGDYFVAKGISDLPPGMVLASALLMYYAPRFQEPAVREKGSKFVRWCKARIESVYVWAKYRKSGKKPKVDSKSRRVAEDGVFDTVPSAQKEPSNREL